MAIENLSHEPATATGGARGDGDEPPNLKARIWLTLGILLLYRLGAFIPIPNVDPVAFQALLELRESELTGIIHMFSRGAYGRMSIFALSVVPYLLAVCLVHLAAAASPRLKALRQQGAVGRGKMRQYICYATVLLCVVQAYGLSVGLEYSGAPNFQLVLDPGLMFRLTTVATLTAGTMFLIWLAEQITQRGIGNGIALIIFAGIVANLPQALATMLEFARTGAVSGTFIIFALAIALALTAFIVFMENAKREVVAVYSERQTGTRIFGGTIPHLSLKPNTSGIAAPVFASSLLVGPLTVASFPGGIAKGEWLGEMTNSMATGQPIYMAIYAGLIVFFAFFYSKTLFDPTDVARSLEQHSGSVRDIRPGKNNTDHLNYILTRLTVTSAAYLVLVCLLPDLLISYYGHSFYFGGTSLFVIVSVAVETMRRIRADMQASGRGNRGQ